MLSFSFPGGKYSIFSFSQNRPLYTKIKPVKGRQSSAVHPTKHVEDQIQGCYMLYTALAHKFYLRVLILSFRCR